MVVFAGLDANPAEAHSAHSTFSLTVIDEDGAKRTYKEVRADQLVRMIQENGVNVLAFDNLAELAPFLNRLVFELSKLERNVDFVEVAYDEPLESKAQKLGLKVEGRLSPTASSEVVAELAKRGLGKKLDFFAPKTLIKIVRRRVPGSGGSSTLRFKRNIETQIKFLAHRIKEKLERAKLDFDHHVRESSGGYSSAVFVVYTPVENLRGIVYSSVSRDYAVKVERVHTKFKYKPPANPQRPLIVGYDPGMTTGLAILDTEGNLLALYSSKNFDRMDVASFCLRYGKPVIVSTDVCTPPQAVKKLSSSFGAKMFYPPQDLSVQEKRELVRRFDSQKIKNTHERDALAAAAKAYLFYSQLLRNTKQKTTLEGISAHFLEVLELVLNGKSVTAAISEIKEKYAVQEAPKAQPQVSQSFVESRVKELESELELLKARVLEYERRIVELNEQKNSLEAKITTLLNERDQSLRKEREVAILEQRLNALQKMLEEEQTKLKAQNVLFERLLWMVKQSVNGKLLFVNILEDLTLSSVSAVCTKKQEVLYVKKPSSFDKEALALLKKAGVLGLIVPEKEVSTPFVFEEIEMPLVSVSRVEFYELPGVNVGAVSSDVIKTISEEKKELQKRVRARKMEELRRMLVEGGAFED
jgi:predicted RNase H-like nuclease (RuvC/YqgF family)